jgi:hypothetical protein
MSRAAVDGACAPVARYRVANSSRAASGSRWSNDQAWFPLSQVKKMGLLSGFGTWKAPSEASIRCSRKSVEQRSSRLSGPIREILERSREADGVTRASRRIASTEWIIVRSWAAAVRMAAGQVRVEVQGFPIRPWIFISAL